MSQERRKRQQERQAQEQPKPLPVRSIVVAVAIVIAFAAAYYFGWHRRTSRLDAFAQCLTAKKVKMYGAFWCPHCEDQKDKFGSSFDYAPYVECGIKGSKAIEPVCTQNDIKHYPTWVFADGTRVEGAQELTFLGDKTGCALP
jgi:hypothetical protein